MATRVLVVDDDEVSREVLAVLLEGAGHTVEAVDSGEAALMYLRTVRPLPEVVLADWQMPGVAGEELARRMREIFGGTTVLLAMSGSELEAGEMRAFDGFLLKPFSMEEFAAAAAGSAKRMEAGQGGLEVLDEAVYAKLAGSMRREKLEALYAMCLKDAEERVDAMRRAAAEGEGETYRKQAHAIKGGCAMVGARELQSLATSMETRGLWDDHVASLDRFLLACGRLRRMLIEREIRDGRETQGPGEEAR